MPLASPADHRTHQKLLGYRDSQQQADPRDGRL